MSNDHITPIVDQEMDHYGEIVQATSADHLPPREIELQRVRGAIENVLRQYEALTVSVLTDIEAKFRAKADVDEWAGPKADGISAAKSEVEAGIAGYVFG